MKLLFTLCLILASTAYGENWKGRFGLGFGLGSSLPLKSETVEKATDDALNGALWAKYHLSERWHLEFDYDRLMYKGYIERLDAYNLMVAYRLSTGRFVPYIGAGAGYVQATNLEDGIQFDYKNNLNMKARLGFDWMATHFMSVNLNLDYHFYDVSNEEPSKTLSAEQFDTFAPMMGVTFYLNSAKGTEAPVAATTPSDTDGDGVADENDNCAATPAGTKVDEKGCPVSTDDDGDGILNSEDKCPGTPAGQKVGAYGCAEKETYTVKLDVKFAPGKTEVDPAFDAQLREVAEFMAKFPETSAVIEGHTDNVGSKALNLSVSKKRAAAVKNYLVKKLGVEAKRLTSEGYGQGKPVADNSTADGKAQNRRVVAVIKATK